MHRRSRVTIIRRMSPTRLFQIPKRLRRPELVRRLPTNANFRDRTGETVNGATVLGYAGILPPNFSAWLCKCNCGQLFVTRSATLNNRSVGCGCRGPSHRLSGTPVYRAWQGMFRRRGKVEVCKRWQSVERFAMDIGPQPGADHVLGRIDARRGFTPANCRWMTRRERRIAEGMLTIQHGGERLSVREWARRMGVSYHAIAYRVDRCRELGADLSEAVATPVGVKMPCVKARQKSRK
jgi:hypothetical protein